MTNSLLARLFFILVATTGLVWLLQIGSIYVGTRQEVEGVLDSRLQEAARMVASLVTADTMIGRSEATGAQRNWTPDDILTDLKPVANAD